MFAAWLATLVLATAPQGRPAPSETAVSIDTQPAEAHVFLRRAGSEEEPLVCTGHCALRLAPGSYEIEGAMRFNSRPAKADELLLLEGGRPRHLRVTVRENTLVMNGGKGLLYAGAALVAAGFVWTFTDPGYDPYAPPDRQKFRGAPLIGIGFLCDLGALGVAVAFGANAMRVRDVAVPIDEGTP